MIAKVMSGGQTGVDRGALEAAVELGFPYGGMVPKGTAGEIAQENEVLRRVRMNGDRGLRGFVAQVLRETKWQFRDGHPNTDVGRRRCYNRVYSLMNPLRRSKTGPIVQGTGRG